MIKLMYGILTDEFDNIKQGSDIRDMVGLVNSSSFCNPLMALFKRPKYIKFRELKSLRRKVRGGDKFLEICHQKGYLSPVRPLLYSNLSKLLTSIIGCSAFIFPAALI